MTLLAQLFILHCINAQCASNQGKISSSLLQLHVSRKSAALQAKKEDTGRKGPSTVAHHFRNSLSELVEKMNSAAPHFIR